MTRNCFECLRNLILEIVIAANGEGVSCYGRIYACMTKRRGGYQVYQLVREEEYAGRAGLPEMSATDRREYEKSGAAVNI